MKFGEIPFRPVERAEASGPEGDGEGLSSSSYWPPCAASEEVGRDSGRTGRGSLGPYMYDTYPPYLDQGLIQAVSTVSGPRYSRYSMYCISLYLDRGLIQLIQYVSDCIHTVSYM